MSFLKRLTRGSSAWLLSFSLFMLASFTTLALTVFNSGYLKDTLVKNDTYKNVVPATLDLATTTATANTTDKLSPQAVAGLTPVVSSALTPEFLQSTTESVINGTFAWLSSGLAMPDFAIPTSDVKDKLVANTSTYLNDRMVALPVCPAGVSYDSFDPLNATCKPPVPVNPASINLAASDFADSIPLLQQQEISIKSLNLASSFASDKPIQKVPNIYTVLTRLPIVFAALALTSGVVLLLLSPQKLRAWRTIGHTFVIAGIFLIAVGGLTILLNSQFTARFFGDASAQQLSFVNTIFTPLLRAVSNSFAYYSMYFGVAYAIIGAGCYFLAHRMRLNHPDATSTEAESAAQSISQTN